MLGIGRYNFEANGYAATTSSGVTASSYCIGIAPTYSAFKGPSTLSFGLGVGALFVSSAVNSDTATRSRLAVSPQIEVDFDIGSGFTLNVGVELITTFDSFPRPSLLSPAGGIGYPL